MSAIEEMKCEDPRQTQESQVIIDQKVPENELLLQQGDLPSDKSLPLKTSTSFSTSPKQLQILPLVEANIMGEEKTSPSQTFQLPQSENITTQETMKDSMENGDEISHNVTAAVVKEEISKSGVIQPLIVPINPIVKKSSLSLNTQILNASNNSTIIKSPLLQQPSQSKEQFSMSTPKLSPFQPSFGNSNNFHKSSQKNNKSNINTTGSQNDSSDIQKFTATILSQPYLLFNTPNMLIPGLDASQDNLYNVYTFIVPNQPLQTVQNITNSNSVQFLKKLASSDSASLNLKPMSTSSNNNLNNSLNQLHTPTTIKSSNAFPSHPGTTTPSGISPTGFQKAGEGSVTKSSSKLQNNSAFGPSSNLETPKIPHFGLGEAEKTERRMSMSVAQSLVDLIKQQSQPPIDEEKRNKSESVPTFNSLNGFKSSNFQGNSSVTSTKQGLSQSSITSLLNLSLNPRAHLPSSSQTLHQNLGALIGESQHSLELFNESEDVVQNLLAQNMIKNEDNGSKNMVNNDDECEEEFDDENDQNNEEEEARLIREIKEMKWNHNNGLNKEGQVQKFLSEGQDGDIFDFCEELNAGKKNKKNIGGLGHKNKFDTKNLVKNFLNSFISFVHHPDEEAGIIDVLGFDNGPQLNDFRTSLRNFFKGKKFNRVLLKEFIFEDLFRPLFLFFLENRALTWIEAGRMKDKASHLRALKNFIFVCQNHDQIKSWRFRYNFVQN